VDVRGARALATRLDEVLDVERQKAARALLDFCEWPNEENAARLSTVTDALVVVWRQRHFIEEVCGDAPELATDLRIEERELETGGRN